MLQRNRELRWELIGYLSLTAAVTGVGAYLGCGLFTCMICLLLGSLHFAFHIYRYHKLQKLSEDLENLLSDGTPLPIQAYSEGELSVLSNQIQKMTLRLTEAAENLKEDKLQLAQSLADISHQLRTPVTAMHLTVSMLSAPEMELARRQELVMEIKGLLGRIQWLVETLLKLSRLDAGTAVMEPENMPVADLVEKAIQPLRISLELRQQQLKQCCCGTVWADPVWTAEALGNVLKNAMEHTPEGGTITVWAEENPLFTQLVVEDTGPGFAPLDIPHLFQRFYKGKNASESNCGIGLSLARAVIAAQNGTITAENTGSGARFVVKFYKQII